MGDIGRRLEGVDTATWLDTHSEPFVVIDAQYTIVAANHAYAAAYGTEADRIIGRKCHEVSHRSEEPCHRHGESCPHRSVYASGRATQVVHVHFDARGQAERVRLTARPLPLADGTFLMSESVQRLGALEDDDAGAMVGSSPAFSRMLSQLVDAAASDQPLLLSGETGAGKEVAARYVHQHSRRCRGPMVVIDCTAIPESLFESEVFGHEKGAFTGPSSRRIGLAEEAEGGTLFFDEIGELPPAMQAKLLRFVESGEFRRLGSNQLRRVDCRVISATHRVLTDLVERSGFRRDLYYRLAGVEVTVPPLRERRADIMPLVAALLAESQRRSGSPGLTEEAGAALLAHDFPGNIRELRNVILRAAQRAGPGWIEASHLGIDGAASALPDTPADRGRSAQGEMTGLPLRPIRRADLSGRIGELCGCGLSRHDVAQQLGISERTVYRHLARQNLLSAAAAGGKGDEEAQGPAARAESIAASR